jgi:hypothetical protein
VQEPVGPVSLNKPDFREIRNELSSLRKKSAPAGIKMPLLSSIGDELAALSHHQCFRRDGHLLRIQEFLVTI